MENKKIFLTQTVQKGGCAAKIAARELRRILSRVQMPAAHAELLVDGRYFDDAAVYRVSDEIAMVQTLDFFTPIVDSPRIFGAIAAANALSDVYAMGGSPKTAMGILAFPLATLDSDIIVELMQGASDKISEAGANFVGGHSIDDDTLKFGLSVTGFVNPKRVWSNTQAKAGDVLILTKALGTGTQTAALKRQEVKEADIQEALDSMMQLNNILELLAETQINSIHAATDVTGFGLSGHAQQMARASSVLFEINFSKLAYFTNTIEFLQKGFLTKAHRTNAEYVSELSETSGLTETERLLINDPQTSGGLLLSVSADGAEEILRRLRKKFTRAEVIGRVSEANEKSVRYVR
jgi:selenide,water dikinase